MAGDDFPAPSEGFVLTHFIVAGDVARSRDFYTGVLGGSVVMDGEPTIVKLANGWVIINVGGGPTDDKPEVAEFLTPPKDHGREIRCYMRDPDGHLIEVGQTTGVPGGR